MFTRYRAVREQVVTLNKKKKTAPIETHKGLVPRPTFGITILLDQSSPKFIRKGGLKKLIEDNSCYERYKATS